MLRVTARLGFALLLLAYVTRPFFQLSGWGRELLLQRRYVGLSAALSLTVHFGYVVSHLRLSGESLDLLTVVFGGAAFVLAWAMTLTSSRAAQQKLDIYWRRLHLTGMDYLWLIYMQTFVGRVLAGDSVWAEVMVLLGLVALGIRLSARLNQRFSRTA
jgi:DMSO/TMAO reductase YedYZ heme-binding membrane subunit